MENTCNLKYMNIVILGPVQFLDPVTVRVESL